MAEAVNLTVDDLMAEVGRLHMEVKTRALREDRLVAELARVQAEEPEPKKKGD